MTELIKVNTGRLRNDASDVKDHIRSIKTKIEELRGHNSTLDAMWDGPSSEAFKLSFANDIASLESIMGALESMNEFEENARKKYDDCESKVADLVDQVKVV